MWKCNSCNTENPNNANFCCNCGARRPTGQQGTIQKSLQSRTAILLSATVICVVAGVWMVNTLLAGDDKPVSNESRYFNSAYEQEISSTPVPTPDPSPVSPVSPPPVPTVPTAPVPTPIITPEPDPVITPSVEDVRAFGDEITYPKSSSYLSEYETMYVKSGKGHSIYVYWKAQGKDEYRRKFYLYEQDEVTVIARENGFSCVIFTAKDGEEHIGWVGSSLLVYEY